MLTGCHPLKYYNQKRDLRLLVLPITIVFLVGAAALAGAAFELATGIRFVTVAPPWLLKPKLNFAFLVGK